MNKAAIVSLAVVAATAKPITDVKDQVAFQTFAKKFNKSYDMKDIFNRFNTFKSNLAMINSHDAVKHGYSMSVNEFADMSWDEFRTMYKGYNHRERSHIRGQNLHVTKADETLATDIDWTTKGAVTPVKNQGQCGSCWSFSTTGSVEGAWQVAGNDLVSLSEQQLVDCAGAQGNQGCNGGLMDDAFEFIIQNKGLTTEAAYPYTGQEGTCKTGLPVAATISSYKDVTAGSEEDLMSAVNIGPVSIAIEADQSAFQFYSGGVMDGTCGKSLDHGVLLVGYGTESGKDYWKVKNSWGASWGDGGYINLVRGKDQCGLADSASYPVV